MCQHQKGKQGPDWTNLDQQNLSTPLVLFCDFLESQELAFRAGSFGFHFLIWAPKTCRISYFELVTTVTGERGCYQGPDAYRASGYIEGLGLTGTPSVVNWLFAYESVYDFATMQQQFFINDYAPGLGLSDSIWGVTVSA